MRILPECLVYEYPNSIDYEHGGDPIKSGKLHIIVSEISPYLAKNASIGAALYFSTKAMKRLQTICKKMYPIVLAKTMNEYIGSICKVDQFANIRN